MIVFLRTPVVTSTARLFYQGEWIMDHQPVRILSRICFRAIYGAMDVEARGETYCGEERVPLVLYVTRSSPQ